MEIRGKTPRRGENRNHWETDKLKPGEELHGWLAGNPVCVTCHEAATTKPCLKRYTGFDVPCPGCAARLKLVDIMYQPLWRPHPFRQCVVPLRESQVVSLEKLALHQSVTVGRPKGRAQGRWIMPKVKPDLFEKTASTEFPACIAHWLPVLWGYMDRITGEQLLRGPVFDSTDYQMVSEKALRATEEEEMAKLQKANEELHRARLRGKTPQETLINVANEVFKVTPSLRHESNGNGKHG